MTREPLPDTDPPARATDLRLAGAWLARHDLTYTRPTPLLANRLAVRERARLAAQVILAVLIIASALAATSAFGGSQPHRPLPLLALTALVAGLLLAQSLLDRWVRRVDQRAGATLSRRAAHLIHPGWRTVLGRPYAVFAVATFTGAMALAASALTIPDPTVRQLAVILLIGLLGVTAINAMQLRHLLRYPVVAEDEESLTADVIMRVEDARDLTTPSVQWSLPMVLLFGTAPGWLSAAAVAYLILGLAAYIALRARTPSSTTVARRAMSTR
ncbi:putative integral membrane protein [Streptosporangium becharense]|uniref:Putative integral membrane protein n=1 Tax=Streptosporangium becharense TaxID=1816182 RepID=A0A7W9MDV6_9ACTN|nr:hypothetical protein [Streptosporangium becharense]MBB2914153.1 putative integral membrane protein [Streptosporangium becharense]MBB5817180.1 putative integral membrane protein [Streptosporangium becharense]